MCQINTDIFLHRKKNLLNKGILSIQRQDDILIDKLLKGDFSAFDTLFSKYASRLHGFSYRYLKTEADAEELVQIVFIKVWENRFLLKNKSSFRSYLFTIAYHEILKYFRSKAYLNSYIKEALFVSNKLDNQMEGVEYASVLDEVDRIINKLPERRRLIFLKSRKEGLSSKEIAKELNISPGTVDNNISEALKFLRESFRNENFMFLLLLSLFLQ